MTIGAEAAYRLDLLQRVYGDPLDPKGIESVSARVEDLIAASRERCDNQRGQTNAPEPKPLPSSPTWLITYADQFQHGTELPLRTLRRTLDRLGPVVDGVHVLPFHPWTSDGGFSVKDYDRVDSRYGTWEDVRAIAARYPMMFDAVINHLSVEGPWFQGFLAGDPAFADFFRVGDPTTDHSAVVRPRTHPLFTPFAFKDDTTQHVWTTFSPDQADLNFENPEVLLRVLHVLIDYVVRGASAIRLDAVGFLWKDERTPSIHLQQTHDLIKLMRSTLDALAQGTLLISETNVPHAENTSYLAHATPHEAEVHAVYQFPLAPLVAHAVLSGDTSVLRSWLDALKNEGLPAGSFLNFLASHDGIGVRPAEGLLDSNQLALLTRACTAVGGQVSMRTLTDGDHAPYELNTTWFDLMRFDADTGGLVDDAEAVRRHLACHEVMLALPGIAGIYVHSLFGSSNDQRIFTASGHNRDLNRARFHDMDALWNTAEDPASREGQLVAGLSDLVARRRAGTLDLEAALDRL